MKIMINTRRTSIEGVTLMCLPLGASSCHSRHCHRNTSLPPNQNSPTETGQKRRLWQSTNLRHQRPKLLQYLTTSRHSRHNLARRLLLHINGLIYFCLQRVFDSLREPIFGQLVIVEKNLTVPSNRNNDCIISGRPLRALLERFFGLGQV